MADITISKLHDQFDELGAARDAAYDREPAPADLEEKVENAISAFSRYAGVALFFAALGAVIYFLV